MIPTKDNHVSLSSVMITEKRPHNRRPIEVDGYTAFVRSPKLCRIGFQVHLLVSALYPRSRIFRVVASHRCSKPMIRSTKAYYGHSLGASAAIEGIICTLALQHGFVPPPLNYEEPDPACSLDMVPNQPRENCSLSSKSPCSIGGIFKLGFGP
jgi:Beta-ketoacyl synthase, C-terminal domain